MSSENAPNLVRNVSDTAAWVAYYRAAETKRRKPLFRDPLAEKLMGDRGPAIAASMGHNTNWSLVTRTVVIDRLITKQVYEQGCDTVINLASGLDTRPFRMDLPAQLRWVEVDMPEMVAYKEDLLRNEKPRCERVVLTADLSKPIERRAALAKAVQDARKIALLTEGLLVYLNESDVVELSRDLLALPVIHCWIADVIGPELQRRMQKLWDKHLASAPMRFYPADVPAFFSKVGWTQMSWTSIIHETARLRRGPRFLRWLTLISPLVNRRRDAWLQRFTGVGVFEPTNRAPV